MRSLSYTIKLEIFEGPFDLLFHLIEKSKIDIYNIPISEITEQYLQYLKNMEECDLEITSEFLVMAATLIEIKSKMLLPSKQERDKQSEEANPQDPRKNLVEKLIEYKQYKNVAIELKKREEKYKKVFYKQQEQLEHFFADQSNENMHMETTDLLKAFSNLLKKREQLFVHKINIHQIPTEKFTLKDKMKQIKKCLINKNILEFQQLFTSLFNKSEVVVTFLALLELIKQNFLLVQQNENFGDIVIKKL